MEKFKNYINRFFRKTQKNQYTPMKCDEAFAFMEEIMDSEEPSRLLSAVGALFGFVGYRAAVAEMKGGDAV